MYVCQLADPELALKATTAKIKDRSLAIVKLDKGSTAWKVNEAEIKRLELEQEGLDDEVGKLKHALAGAEENNFTIEQFLNLSKLARTKLEAASAEGKDRICQMIFLNFVVNEEKVVDFQMREPFATLLKTRNALNGRPERTRTQLTDTKIRLNKKRSEYGTLLHLLIYFGARMRR